MGLTLREVGDEDLPLLFEQWADPVAAHMAAFTAPDHMDRDAFERRWSRLRADETVLTRVIVVDDEVAGTIGSWGDSGEREVTYWIGRSYWGKGIATDALNAFLAVDRSRPLHAHVASDNVASRRVLEKCGFRVIATERNVAEARSAEIEELVLRLEELALGNECLPNRWRRPPVRAVTRALTDCGTYVTCFSRWGVHTAGARWAGRPGSLRPSSRLASRLVQAQCPDRRRGTAACPGR
jgi:RimJ/RimL family protein N-acetyltransferase